MYAKKTYELSHYSHVDVETEASMAIFTIRKSPYESEEIKTTLSIEEFQALQSHMPMLMERGRMMKAQAEMEGKVGQPSQMTSLTTTKGTIPPPPAPISTVANNVTLASLLAAKAEPKMESTAGEASGKLKSKRRCL